MLEKLQKYAPTISILLLVDLLTALFFYPLSSRVLSTIIIAFGVGTAIIFTVHGNWQEHNPLTSSGQEKGNTTRPQFIRNTLIDLLGLALVMGVAMWLGRLAGIIAGMAVGFGVAFLVQKVWGKVAEPVKA